MKRKADVGEAAVARAEEDRELAASAEAWLMTLRESLQEVEAYTQEAFDKRRELVRLLVDRIVVSRAQEGRPKVEPIGLGRPLQRISKSVCMVNETPAG